MLDLSAKDGGAARFPDTKSGPRTVWLGPEVAKLVVSLPRRAGEDPVFSGDLTSSRLYGSWTGLRDEAGLSGMRIHDARHT